MIFSCLHKKTKKIIFSLFISKNNNCYIIKLFITVRVFEIFWVNITFWVFHPIIRVFINFLFASYCKYFFFVEIRNILNCLFIKFIGCWFSAKTNTFSPMSKFSRNFFFLAAYFFLSYLSSLSCVFFTILFYGN